MMLIVATLTVAFAAGCAGDAVGDPCLPEQIPETGFDQRESYVESSSVNCETRVCLVYKLKGIPMDDCSGVAATGPSTCPPDDPNCVADIPCVDKNNGRDDRVYCTCRCKAPSDDFAECECPEAYDCKTVLERGGPGVEGDYCVLKGT